MISVSTHARGFQIVYMKQGKRITAYRKREDSANEFAARMHAQLLASQAERDAAGELPELPGDDELAELRARYGARSTLEGQQQVMWDLQLLVMKYPRDEDYQRTLKTQAAAATAQSKLRDRAQEERTLAAAERKFELARKRRAAKQVESAKHHQQGSADRAASSVH